MTDLLSRKQTCMTEPSKYLAAVGVRDVLVCGTQKLDMLAAPQAGYIRQQSMSVLPRSLSVPGRSFPGAGYQLTLGVRAAGIWALEYRPPGPSLADITHISVQRLDDLPPRVAFLNSRAC